jgi:putative phosphoribosyl transferase
MQHLEMRGIGMKMLWHGSGRTIVFEDRHDAGRRLAERLLPYARRPDALVLALPRGGVPVAYELAKALDLPLDVFSVRKLGAPGHEELALGAIGSGGGYYLNIPVIRSLDVNANEIRDVIDRERHELERRERLYRDNRPRPEIHGKIAILVDDGLATGASMRAAITALRRLDPAQIVVAVPVAPIEVCTELRNEIDDLVCYQTPYPFDAVGLWYRDFSQTTDEEVRRLLAL